ncbi:MAG: hypothetical protein Q7T18_06045, partial [Sedimentisphaerales bacterium]|nr:hypothetical protein [Sedimentisphaerales bacterium]
MKLTAGMVLAIYRAGGTLLFRRVVHFYSAVYNKLLESTVRVISTSNKIELAAVDSTGLEAGHISKYFVRRKRVKQLEI